MIRYHGGPITPANCGYEAWKGAHAMVSFAHPSCLRLAAEVSQSFVLDNGAFSAWKSGKAMDVAGYIEWVNEWRHHPGFDWCVIPDVIDGDEDDNREAIEAWELPRHISVPVWHMHESLLWLEELASEWPRIAIGSSGEYATPGTDSWWQRMIAAMNCLTDEHGRPTVKVHGLRMMDPRLFSLIPFASVDSCTVALNIALDKRWNGTWVDGMTKEVRAMVLAKRFESHAAASMWDRSRPLQSELLLG